MINVILAITLFLIKIICQHYEMVIFQEIISAREL